MAVIAEGLPEVAVELAVIVAVLAVTEPAVTDYSTAVHRLVKAFSCLKVPGRLAKKRRGLFLAQLVVAEWFVHLDLADAVCQMKMVLSVEAIDYLECQKYSGLRTDG